eukprot:218839-Chlamydomonas_euryale.AAC.10
MSQVRRHGAGNRSMKGPGRPGMAARARSCAPRPAAVPSLHKTPVGNEAALRFGAPPLSA